MSCINALDELGRNLRHWTSTVHDLTARGLGPKILSGRITAIDTKCAAGKLVFGIFAALPDFERALIHWLHCGYSIARERDEAIRLVKKAAESNRWVIEGIYGFLIDEIKSDATALVWLCLDDAACVMHIRQRGIQGNGTVEAFSALQNWAASYRSREGSSSYSGHAVLFEKYMGEKIVLRSRNCVAKFAKHFA